MRRRTVLQGALAGSVVTATSVAGGNEALAAPRGGVVPAGPDATRFVNGPAGQAVRVPADLGVRITVGSPAARARVVLTYDDRLYAVASRPVLVRGAQAIPLQTRVSRIGTTHQRAIEVALPELAPGTYTVHAGGMAPARFPADLIADPVPTEVKLSEATGSVTAQVLSRSMSAQGLPWGAQIGAGWQQFEWGAGYYAWCPALVTVHSVGPGVVPAGSRVRVTLDRQVFESVQLTSARGSNGQRIGGVGRRGTLVNHPVATWTLHTAITAGSRITLTCTPTFRSLQDPLEYVDAPLVEFLPPKKSSTPQRLTGQESQTRHDDAYSPDTRARFAPA
ncbi:hypothetical protein [Kribbella sp. NPDC004875]|uniref:hypothetical protein n=1 Tax=Kribbella sp. NPDC004875 TaxID=3364107 RepID=UPI0036795BDD